jgi:hypothetical protein
MKHMGWVVGLVCLLSSSAYACPEHDKQKSASASVKKQAVQVDFDFQIDGQTVSKPKIVTPVDTAAQVLTRSETSEFKVTVTPKNDKTDSVSLAVTVEMKNGAETKTFQAEVRTSWDTAGKITGKLGDKPVIVFMTPRKA